MIEQIRNLVGIHGQLEVPIETLSNRDNLWEAGLASFQSLRLMLALEDSFEVEFPSTEMPTFECIDAIAANIARLQAA